MEILGAVAGAALENDGGGSNRWIDGEKNDDFKAKPFGACLRPLFPPLIGAKLAGILAGACRAIAYTNCPFFYLDSFCSFSFAR